MRLIVTRPPEDAQPLAERLATAGHQAIVAPLLTILRTAELNIPARDYQAILITSANGARALAGRPGIERLTGIQAIVVGPASAQAARQVGFSRIAEADGDVIALARKAIASLRPEDGPLLYISGAVTAGELAASLEASGFDVDRVVAYEARPVEALPDLCASALAAGAAEGVMLFSPRTARIWATLVVAAGLAPAAVQLIHYCLSDNVAIALRHALGNDLKVRVSARPDEAGMLELVSAPA
jgi:uroporphyrinogen-III synthase